MHHMRRHRRTVWLASACSVSNKLWDLAPPVLIGAAVDTVVEQDASLLATFGFVDVTTQLWVLVGLTVVVWGLESAFEYAFAVLWRNLAQTVQHELRIEAYEHIQTLDVSWFSEQRRGDLLAILNDDINQLERFLDKGANDVLQVGTTVIAVGILFFALAWQVALLAILPIPIILWGSFRFQHRIQPLYGRVRAEVGHLGALLENNLDGITTIQSFTGELREVARVTEASQRYREANREAIRLSSAFVPLIRMAILVGFCATLLWGGRLVMDGTLAVGTYSVLIFMTQRLLWPLTRLGETFDLYQRAMASAVRVLNLIDTPVARIEGDHEPLQVAGSVRFSNIDFAYPGREPLLKGLSLDLVAGKTTAVVGATGSGKTTLVRLLLRMYDAQAGVVEVDGVATTDWKLKRLRTNIALVSQRITLFPGSIADNIRYGKPEASDAQVHAAASVAEATQFIAQLPDGLNTQVGEGGQKLSGGQQQRISIARAVLKDAPILVLDEATSAVDNETEAALQRSLARISVGRTTLVIAHRLSTVRHADRIVVLDAGQVVEQGTHDELTGAQGLYHRLWQVQTGSRASA
jgi:ATP-binding cassette subfamily B protein